ncbi:hypothetical protein EU528_00820 [Candidatus Thorarchaeota archaeon]|nr:MAG: hypothetical protein EU528_00820 [Candidatus Thorarchaeota archaeon]
MATGYVECTPLCKSFKCDKQPPAMKIRQRAGKKEIWCTWIDEECDGPWCKFGKCLDRRMSDDGRCKPVTKKIETAAPLPRDIDYPDAIPKDIAKKLGRRE